MVKSSKTNSTLTPENLHANCKETQLEFAISQFNMKDFISINEICLIVIKME